jgi:hypothetical protein
MSPRVLRGAKKAYGVVVSCAGDAALGEEGRERDRFVEGSVHHADSRMT